MRPFSVILLVGLSLFSRFASGQLFNATDDYNAHLWQIEDGLPNNTVQAITQTSDGYLWVGTREGLARFDGVNFDSVDLMAGQQFPSISCLHQDRDGTLWIGSDNHGLFCLSAGKIRRLPGPNGELDFDVHEIHESKDGIWITSSSKALHLVHGKWTQQIALRRVLQGICVDTNGAAWTVGGDLIRLDTKLPANYPLQAGSPDLTARCLYCDSVGSFWMGDGDDLVHLQNRLATVYRQPNSPSGYVSVIFRDRIGQLWVGSYLGLSRFVNGQFISNPEPDAPQYRIYAISEDREGNMWIGSEEGLIRLTRKIFKTITKKDGLAVNTVVSVCASRDGSVWISPWGCGLDHWVDGKITALTSKDGLSSSYIMAMAEGHDGGLWAGADHGGNLNHIQNGQTTIYGRRQGFVTKPSTATTALYEDNRNVLWIGSRELLQCWDGKHFSSFTTNNGLSNQKINAICGGSDDIVWIGTEAGLTRWENGRFQNLAATNAELKVLILSLYQDPDENLWIGTKGNGLLEFKNGIVHRFTSAHGLFSDAIYSILEDDNHNLWLNSSRGIFRVDKRQLQAIADGKKSTISSITYGKADGILSSGQYQEVTQPSACKSRDGHLWFRTTQGVAVVNPNELDENKLPPPVVIQEVFADRHLVGNSNPKFDIDNKIVIPPGRGDLELRYQALSFRAPEKNQFRYKLEGVDLNWVDAGTRRAAFYNNLRPGHYRFKVIACNNDGIWNETGASISLVLKPFFWQTWWFLSLVCIAGIGLISGTARYITRQRMERKLARLERQNAVEKERIRIARDMHDELGAKLTRISFLGDTARRCDSIPAETNQHIAKMSEAARELILSLDQIVWAVDPENDSLENLANYICRYASEFAKDSPIQCKFKIPWKLPGLNVSTEVRHNVFLAVKEALNNAIKHSGATEIVLTITVKDGEFEICVSDNGCGIIETKDNGHQEMRRKGRGLTNMRQRLTMIRGKLELKSEPGCGTQVRFIIPLDAQSATKS